MKDAFNAQIIKNKTEQTIKNLLQQLSQLIEANGLESAPSISLDSAFQPAADYDAMLGSMLADGFLGEAFDNTVAYTAIDTDIVDLCDEYLSERAQDQHNNYGRGRGSIALYEKLGQAVLTPANDVLTSLSDAQTNIEETLAGLQNEFWAWDRVVSSAAPQPIYA